MLLSNQGEDPIFTCPDTVDGINGRETCGAKFSTQKQLAVHRRRCKKNGHTHGHLIHINSFVVTNQCPWCKSLFASVESATQHARNAILIGHCAPGRAFMPSDIKVPKDLSCPVCCVECPTLEAYYDHIVEHVGAPPTKFHHVSQFRTASEVKLVPPLSTEDEDSNGYPLQVEGDHQCFSRDQGGQETQSWPIRRRVDANPSNSSKVVFVERTPGANAPLDHHHMYQNQDGVGAWQDDQGSDDRVCERVQEAQRGRDSTEGHQGCDGDSVGARGERDLQMDDGSRPRREEATRVQGSNCSLGWRRPRMVTPTSARPILQAGESIQFRRQEARSFMSIGTGSSSSCGEWRENPNLDVDSGAQVDHDEARDRVVGRIGTSWRHGAQAAGVHRSTSQQMSGPIAEGYRRAFANASVTTLKTRCKDCGLAAVGSKQILIERLVEHIIVTRR